LEVENETLCIDDFGAGDGVGPSANVDDRNGEWIDGAESTRHSAQWGDEREHARYHGAGFGHDFTRDERRRQRSVDDDDRREYECRRESEIEYGKYDDHDDDRFRNGHRRHEHEWNKWRPRCRRHGGYVRNGLDDGLRRPEFPLRLEWFGPWICSADSAAATGHDIGNDVGFDIGTVFDFGAVVGFSDSDFHSVTRHPRSSDDRTWLRSSS
jgi:hypothetical protein